MVWNNYWYRGLFSLFRSVLDRDASYTVHEEKENDYVPNDIYYINLLLCELKRDAVGPAASRRSHNGARVLHDFRANWTRVWHSDYLRQYEGRVDEGPVRASPYRIGRRIGRFWRQQSRYHKCRPPARHGLILRPFVTTSTTSKKTMHWFVRST